MSLATASTPRPGLPLPEASAGEPFEDRQSFVRAALINPSDAEIVQNSCNGARSGLEVIAEGVEQQAQLDLVLVLGCYLCQGYLLSRPLPLAQFGELLQAHSA